MQSCYDISVSSYQQCLPQIFTFQCAASGCRHGPQACISSVRSPTRHLSALLDGLHRVNHHTPAQRDALHVHCRASLPQAGCWQQLACDSHLKAFWGSNTTPLQLALTTPTTHVSTPTISYNSTTLLHSAILLSTLLHAYTPCTLQTEPLSNINSLATA